MSHGLPPTSPPPGAEFYPPAFVANLLWCHVDTVLAMIKAGKIEAIMVGREYRIPRSELPRLREKLRYTPNSRRSD